MVREIHELKDTSNYCMFCTDTPLSGRRALPKLGCTEYELCTLG